MIRIGKKRIENVELPYWTKFWGRRCKVKPKFVRAVLGDGNKLVAITPMQTRPHYYLIRVDSSWGESNYSDGDTICDHLDEIYDAIEDEYGYYFDGHSSEYDKSNGEYPGWPVFWQEGISWYEVDPKEIYRNRKIV